MTSRTDFGKHYLVDFINCDPETIKFVKTMREIFLKAAKESRATLVDHLFHQFEPVGVSGVILIAESHFSVHTWPEDRFVGVDIFTCGSEMDVEVAIECMRRAFRAENVKVKVVTRGNLDNA